MGAEQPLREDEVSRSDGVVANEDARSGDHWSPPKKPPHRRQSRQLPSMGAEKPLLEERCHEVTEWWQISEKL